MQFQHARFPPMKAYLKPDVARDEEGRVSNDGHSIATLP